MRRRAVAAAIGLGALVGVAASTTVGVVFAPHAVTVPDATPAHAEAASPPPCPHDAPWSAEAAACVAPTARSGGAPIASATDVDGAATTDANEGSAAPIEPVAPAPPPTPAPRPAAAPTPAADDVAPAPVVPDPLPMVVRAEDGRRLVRRDAVQAFLQDESAVQRNAPQRTVPHYEGDTLVGYRIEGLRLGTVYTDLGLQDGDTIVRVNGTFIDSPQRGWALFAGLQQTETFVVEVHRRGRTRTLTFSVVDDDAMRAWFEGSGDVPF